MAIEIAKGIHDDPELKLGGILGSGDKDARTVLLDPFVKREAVSAPASWDFDKSRKPFPVHMWGNDQYGDCEVAGRCNYMFRLERVETKKTLGLADNDCILEYKTMTGCENPGDNNDTGLTTIDNLNRWRHGWTPKSQGRLYTIDAYGKVNHRDPALVRLCTYLFHGILIGANMPLTVRDQFRARQPWDVVDNAGSAAYPGSWGGHCVAPETLVLTNDLRWVEIGNLDVGDKLMGFDEFPVNHRRWWRESEVESFNELQLPCYELIFEDGTTVIASYDHRWLTSTASGNYWQYTEDLIEGKTSIVAPVDVWSQFTDYESGYLAAAYDGEGCLVHHGKNDNRTIHRLDFYQRDNAMLQTVEGALSEKGFFTNRTFSTPGVADTAATLLKMYGRNEIMRFLGSIRPVRLLDKFDPKMLGQFGGRGLQGLKLESIQPVGERTVIALGTSTGTYVAEGLASHNCMYGKAYGRDHMKLLTWQREVIVTNRWWDTYVDEAYCVIDSINSWRKAKHAFDVEGLIQAMRDAGINVQY